MVSHVSWSFLNDLQGKASQRWRTNCPGLLWRSQGIWSQYPINSLPKLSERHVDATWSMSLVIAPPKSFVVMAELISFPFLDFVGICQWIILTSALRVWYSIHIYMILRVLIDQHVCVISWGYLQYLCSGISLCLILCMILISNILYAYVNLCLSICPSVCLSISIRHISHHISQRVTASCHVNSGS